MTTDSVDTHRDFLRTGMEVQENTESIDIYDGDGKSALIDNLGGNTTEESVILPQLKIKKIRDNVTNSSGK